MVPARRQQGAAKVLPGRQKGTGRASGGGQKGAPEGQKRTPKGYHRGADGDQTGCKSGANKKSMEHQQGAKGASVLVLMSIKTAVWKNLIFVTLYLCPAPCFLSYIYLNLYKRLYCFVSITKEPSHFL